MIPGPCETKANVPLATSRLGIEAQRPSSGSQASYPVGQANPPNTLPTSRVPAYRAYSSRALEVTVFWKRELLSWKNFSYFSEFRLG